MLAVLYRRILWKKPYINNIICLVSCYTEYQKFKAFFVVHVNNAVFILSFTCPIYVTFFSFYSFPSISKTVSVYVPDQTLENYCTLAYQLSKHAIQR